MGAKILEMFRKILPGHLQRMHGKNKNKASWGNSADKISENALLSSRKIGNAILEKFLPKIFCIRLHQIG